jgi:hypothetical protein
MTNPSTNRNLEDYLGIIWGKGENLGGVGFIAELVSDSDSKRKWFKHYAVQTKTAAIARIRNLDENGKETYITPALFKQASFQDARGRWRYRTRDNAHGARTFWLDIDVGETKGYPTQRAAVQALSEFCGGNGLPLPSIVSSGYGVHCYWQLDKYLPASEWIELAKRIQARAAESGFRVDPSRTADIASVLRPVSTHNRKYPTTPKPVTLKRPGGITAVAQFEALPAVEKKKANVEITGDTGNVIAEWNRTHDVREYLISHGYEDHGDKLLPPGSESRNPGVWIDPDNIAISHHGDDLAGNPRDCFDCYRILEHNGDWSAALAAARHNLALQSGGGVCDLSVKIVDLSDIATSRIDPPEFILHPVFPKNEVTLFGAHGGSGKSYVALSQAVHVALGRPWGNLLTPGGKAMFISLEDSASIVRYRLRQIIDSHGFSQDIPTIQQNLRIIDASEAGALVREVNLAGVREIEPTNAFHQISSASAEFEPDLIFIDNASDAFAGNENDRHQVRSFMKRMMALGKKTNAAVVVLAHINKQSALKGAMSNSYAGSTAWHNSSRSRIAIIDGELIQEKSNHGAVLDKSIPIVWDNGCFKPDPSGTRKAQALSTAQAGDDTAVLAAICEITRQGGTVRAAESGSATTWHSISACSELPLDLQADTREAKKRVKQSAVRLSAAGKIYREAFTQNRNQSYRWVPVNSVDQSEVTPK